MANLKPELGEIILGGVAFPLVGEMRRQKISQFPAKITIGDTSRSDQQHVSEWVITQLTGLGIENMNESEDQGRYWDAYGLWTLDPKCIHLMRSATAVLSQSTGFSPTTLVPVTEAEGTHLFIWKGKLYLTYGNGIVKRFVVTSDWVDVVRAAGYEKITCIKPYTVSGATDETLVLFMPGTGAYLTTTSGDSGAYTLVTGATIYHATVVDGTMVGVNYTDILESTDLASWSQTIEHRVNSKPTVLLPYRLPDSSDEIPVAGFASGLYFIDRTAGIAYKALPFSGGDDTAARNTLAMRADLYVPVDHLLWKISGSVVDEIGPYQDEGLPLPDQRVKKVLEYQGRLLALVDDAILVYDDGWHFFYRASIDGSNCIADMVVGSVTGIAENALFWLEIPTINVEESLYPSVQYLKLRNQGLRLIKDPQTAVDWTGLGWFITPYFDGGFSEWDKVALSVELLGQNLSSKMTVEVYYRMDEETAWKSMGFARVNGRTSLPFNDETGKPLGLTFRKIQLKVQLSRNTANITPILESMTLRYYRNPKELYGWRMVLDCTNPWKGYTGEELAAILRGYDASPPLLTFCFTPEEEHYVKLLNLNTTESTGFGSIARFEIVLGEMG